MGRLSPKPSACDTHRKHKATFHAPSALPAALSADRNFKRPFCRHLGSTPSGAPQRHPPAIRSPGLPIVVSDASETTRGSTYFLVSPKPFGHAPARSQLSLREVWGGILAADAGCHSKVLRSTWQFPLNLAIIEWHAATYPMSRPDLTSLDK